MRNILLLSIAFLFLSSLCLGIYFHKAPVAKSGKEATIFSPMKITSTAFSENTSIPATYSCDAAGINPPLSFSDIPSQAKSLALIVDDPDAPNGTFVHWVVYNIHPTVTNIEEGKGIPQATIGINGIGKEGFIAPCPPSGQHRYYFKLYALDSVLPNPPGANKDEILDAIKGHVISEAQLVGLYKRQ